MIGRGLVVSPFPPYVHLRCNHIIIICILYYMDRCDGLCRLASVAEKVSQSQKRSHSEQFDGRWYLLYVFYVTYTLI